MSGAEDGLRSREEGAAEDVRGGEGCAALGFGQGKAEGKRLFGGSGAGDGDRDRGRGLGVLWRRGDVGSKPDRSAEAIPGLVG